MKKRYGNISRSFIFALTIGAGLALSAGLTVAEDTQTQARALQLEGTKLQLKGDLAGALEKYRQSIKLLPNPRLENIARRLNEKVGKQTTEPTPPAPVETVVETKAAPAQTAVETPAPVAQESVSPPPEDDPVVKEEMAEAAAVDKDAAPVTEPVIESAVKPATDMSTPAVSPVKEDPSVVPHGPDETVTLAGEEEEVTAAEPSESAETEAAVKEEITAAPGAATAEQFVSKAMAPIVPSSPQEALIRKMVSSFTSTAAGMSVDSNGNPQIIQTIQFDSNYPVEKIDETHWKATLGPVRFYLDEHTALSFDTPFSFTATVTGNDGVDVEMPLPATIPIRALSGSTGEEVALLTSENSVYKAHWSESMGACDRYSLSYGATNLSLRSDVPMTISMAGGALLFAFTDTNPDWSYDNTFTTTDLAFTLNNEPLFTLKSADLNSVLKGLDYKTLSGVVKDLIAANNELQAALTAQDIDRSVQLADGLFSGLDTFLALIQNGQSKGVLRQIEFIAPDNAGTFHLDSITVNEESTKDEAARSNSNLVISLNNMRGNFTDQQKPVSFGIKKIRSSIGAGSEPLPRHLLSDTFAQYKPFIADFAAGNTPSETELLPEVITSVKTFLNVLRSYSGGIIVKGLSVTAPAEASLDSFSIHEELNTPGGDGNSYRLNLRLDGVNIPALAQVLPTDANIDLKLSRIPSLLGAIPPKNELETVFTNGTVSAFFQNTFLQTLSGADMVLSLNNNYITFPDAAIRLNGELEQNSSSRTMVQGGTVLAIENPDKINSILGSFPPLASLQRPFAMLNSMTEVSQKNGVSTGTLNLQLTPDGKVIMNSKDVSGMFFPEQQPQ